MVYYIGYYHCDAIRDEGRVVAPAAENKMNYMISAISEAYDGQIEVVSPAETRQRRFVKGKRITLDQRVTLKSFSSFSSRSRVMRGVGHLWTRLLFKLYLWMRVRAGDRLIVYHSLSYMKWFRFLKRIKRIRLTVEVEELYADVTQDEILRKKEIAYLKTADNHVFITELLRSEVGADKPYAVSHGTYRAIVDYGFRFADDRIHAVYAGTFRRAKGGVYTAIEAAEYLNGRYTLEILGAGSDEENDTVQKLIKEVSQKTECRVNYVGFKSGQALNAYIQACHIGLSTQPIDAGFNTTSFPSKVLMYMSNGLRVVSVRIPAVETSDVGDCIDFYDRQDAEEVAKAIRNVKLNDNYDSRARLHELHAKFVEQLKAILLG